MFPISRMLDYANIIPQGVKVKKLLGQYVSASGCYVVLLDDGNLYCTGNGAKGQYGDGTLTNDFTQWKLVQAGVTNVWKGLRNTGCFIIQKDNKLYYTGAPPSDTNLTGIRDVQVYTELPDISSFIGEGDYINDVAFGYNGIFVLIRNESAGTGLIYSLSHNYTQGNGDLNTDSFDKFTLASTAPTNIIQIQPGAGVERWVSVLTSDAKIFFTGSNGSNVYGSVATTSVITTYSPISSALNVLKISAGRGYILWLTERGVYKRGTGGSTYFGTITAGTNKLIADLNGSIDDMNKVLIYGSNNISYIYVPPTINCTAPTSQGVNSMDGSNYQYTIRPGTENVESDFICEGALNGIFIYSSDNKYFCGAVQPNYTTSYPPNIDSRIILPKL